MTDGELLRQYVQGDPRAFDLLVQNHQSGLLRYAQRLTQSPEVAQDVVQETFYRVIKSAKKLSESEQLLHWMYTVCRNLCTDLTRKEVRMQQRQRELAVSAVATAGPAPLEQEESDSKVHSLVQSLPEPDREVLLLKIQEGRTYREIAAITGLSIHKVSAAVHRALRQMARELRAAGLV